MQTIKTNKHVLNITCYKAKTKQSDMGMYKNGFYHYSKTFDPWIYIFDFDIVFKINSLEQTLRNGFIDKI